MYKYSGNRVFRRIVSYNKRNFPIYIALALITIISSLIGVIGIEGLRQMINGAVNKDFILLKKGLFISVIITVIAVPLMSFMGEYFTALLNNKSVKFMQTFLITNILTKKTTDINKFHSGDVVSRFSDSVNLGQVGVNFELRNLFGSILVITFTLLYLSTMNIGLAIGCVIISVVFPSMVNFVAKPLRVTFDHIYKYKAEINSFTQDVVLGGEIVRTYTLKKFLHKKWIKKYDELFVWIKKNIALMMIYIRLHFVIIVGGMLYIFGYGGILVTQKSLDIGGLVAFLFLFQQLSRPVSQIIQFWPKFQSSISNMNRVFELMDLEDDVGESHNKTESNYKNTTIYFNNVSFGYSQNMILNKLSFSAKKGDITAIIGNSGCGKTTLLKLILKLYETSNGSILIGDKPLADIPINKWYESLAYVPQDPLLFSGTIFENISCGRISAKKEEVYEVAKSVFIHEKIINLPKGYDTLVSSSNPVLSGGERQRIAIARAILKNADVILLDEPTSSLDCENEINFIKMLEDLKRNKIIIIVTHGLNILNSVDKVIELKNGEVQYHNKGDKKCLQVTMDI